ncbi:hypothetical protein NPIL_556561, partial [Nephila pilipes]
FIKWENLYRQEGALKILLEKIHRYFNSMHAEELNSMEYRGNANSPSNSENVSPPENYPKPPQSSPVFSSISSSNEMDKLSKFLNNISLQLSGRDPESGEKMETQLNDDFNPDSRRRLFRSLSDGVQSVQECPTIKTDSSSNLNQLSLPHGSQSNTRRTFGNDITSEILADHLEEIILQSTISRSELNKFSKIQLSEKEATNASSSPVVWDTSMNDSKVEISSQSGKSADKESSVWEIIQKRQSIVERCRKRKRHNRKRTRSFDETDYPSSFRRKKM